LSDWSISAPLLVGGIVIVLGGLGVFLMGLAAELMVYLFHSLDKQMPTKKG